jgi:hypothetical protein
MQPSVFPPLLAVLLDPEQGPCFYEYLHRSQASELLTFWLTAEQFRLCPSPEAAQRIWDEFLRAGAPEETNLDDVRFLLAAVGSLL